MIWNEFWTETWKSKQANMFQRYSKHSGVFLEIYYLIRGSNHAFGFPDLEGCSDSSINKMNRKHQYCWWKTSCTSWFIPCFTGFYTSQVVVWDFFHQPYFVVFHDFPLWNTRIYLSTQSCGFPNLHAAPFIFLTSFMAQVSQVTGGHRVSSWILSCRDIHDGHRCKNLIPNLQLCPKELRFQHVSSRLRRVFWSTTTAGHHIHKIQISE